MRKARTTPAPIFHADLVRAMETSGGSEVIPLPAARTSNKGLQRLLDRIGASSVLQLDERTIWHASGMSVPAIAWWQGVAAVEIGGSCSRYRLLAVDSCRGCIVYVIPIGMIDNLKQLPGSGFSESEVKLLCVVANEISGERAGREYFITMKHPAKQDVQFNRDRWHGCADSGDLLALLQERPWLLSAICCALDTQLRVFKQFKDGPLGIYNFTTPAGAVQADDSLSAALCALNFSAAPSFMGTGLPEICLRDKSDLAEWRRFRERLAMIRTATGSLLAPLLDEIDRREHIRYIDGILPPALPTVPIVRCKTVLHRRWVADIMLPKNEQSKLTSAQLDMLRGAIKKALNRQTAQAVYDSWRVRRAAPTAYREDPFACWREQLIRAFFQAVFAGDPKRLSEAFGLLTGEQDKMAQQAEAAEQSIKHALELLADPSRFAREICERPRSKAEARAQLEENGQAVAFRYCPAKGNHAGQMLLAFTPVSLRRLLRRVGCGEELYDAVLDAAAKSGLLAERSCTIRVGQDTITAVTFYAE